MAAYLIGGGISLFILRNLLSSKTGEKINFYWVHDSQRRLESEAGMSTVNYNMPQFLARAFGQVTPYRHAQSDWFAERVELGQMAFDHRNKNNHYRGVAARVNDLTHIRKGPRGFSQQVKPFTAFA